ncbi:MAG TPA: glycoside hydrolase family 5 protein [Polyangiaceae bacterium]
MKQRMRGVNLGGWFSQIDALQGNDPDTFVGEEAHLETFLGSEDFARIRGWGFDHVRLPVDYFNLFSGPELSPVEPTLGRLDRAIDSILAAGLAVIFDLHKCPGHDFHSGASRAQPLFSDPSVREQTKRVWSVLAERYGAREHVTLELLNEPVAENGRDWDELKNELCAHIRRHAPKATLLVGSNRWNRPEEFAALTPFDDDNVVYSFHTYSPLVFTHQKAPWIKGDVFHVNRPYPGTYEIPAGTTHRLPLDTGYWDRARLAQTLDAVVAFRDRHGVPVACNEFGVFVGGADRASQLRWMRDFLGILAERDFGFSYWNYKNLDFGLVSQNERRFAGYPQYAADGIDRELVEVLRAG